MTLPTIVERIKELEALMVGLPQVSCDVNHFFSGGIYIRQVRLKAGSLVMGHRHKTEHLNIMLTGKMRLYRENGGFDDLTAPVVVTAQPGRKVAYVFEDTIWLNLFPTTETDVETLEAEYLDKTDGWQEFSAAFRKDRDADRQDFDQFLWELQLDAEYVRRESENTADQIPLPQGVYKFKVGRSEIEGKGLIATADIEPGEVIAPARIDGKRTPAGRYTNHSKSPNAIMVPMNGDIALMAIRPIAGCEGGLDGEEITVDYREAIKTNVSASQ